jgi:hypothetical protein
VASPGCTAAGASARPAEPNAFQASAGHDRAACHVELPDAQVTIAELADGVMLIYATDPNQVAALRDTIRRYVDWQNHPRTIVDRRHVDDVEAKA